MSVLQLDSQMMFCEIVYSLMIASKLRINN